MLAEAASLGFTAIEAGPPGFLPVDPGGAAQLLAAHGLRLVAGFVPLILHDRAMRADELSELDRRAGWLRTAGAEVLVLAASAGRASYKPVADLTGSAWATLLETAVRAEEIAAGRGLTLAVHPHFGTAIERRSQMERFINECQIGLCLDTGHLAVGGMDPVEAVRIAPQRVRHVHLKDVDATVAARLWEDTLGYREAVARGLFQPLGRGDARIREVLEVLQATQYSGWYVIEHDTVVASEAGDPAADIRQSLDFLSRA